MRILFIAPQPFYTERGTPIAVRMMLETLSAAGHRIDLLTYHEGTDVEIDGVTIHRIRRPPGIRNVPIGPSWKKIVCDIWLARELRRLVRSQTFDLIHAVEESAYLVWLLRRRHRLPWVVDMDSSIPLQLGEKYRWLRPLLGPVAWLERRTLRGAVATTAVCERLAEIARSADPPGPIHLIEDVALTAPPSEDRADDGPSLRTELSVEPDAPLLLYVGNLEGYQGIDLMLEALTRVRSSATLAVIGGPESAVARWREHARQLDIGDRVRWAGPRPLGELGRNLRQADVLLSPRTRGDNTPMKIYSYLASGVPVVATSISSHTQVLTPDVSVLTEPSPEEFASGVDRLLDDPGERSRLGRAARELAEARYSRSAFDAKVRELYDAVESRLTGHEVGCGA